MKLIILLTIVYGTIAVPVEDQALQEFVNGNRIFTAGIYKEILKKETGNFIASPISAEIILALTNEGAKGVTSRELVTGLSLPNTKEKTQKAIKSFLPHFRRSEDGLKLLSANKIYTGQNVKLENDFSSIATTIYESAVENVDFTKNIEAASTINNWVEDRTNHKIKNLINPEIITNDTRIVLVNALYFAGKWVTQFDDYLTSQKPFFLTKDHSINVDTMHQTKYFNYYENPTLNAKFLELPYEGGDISMVIILPNEKEGLTNLEQNIEQLVSPQPFKSERVDVELPKFTIETNIDLIPILENLGVRRLFTSAADISGISATNKNLYVSHVIQKAFIKVNEAGTEAAAATAVVADERSAHFYRFDPEVFHADHPFLYLIKSKGVILFIGRYTKP